MSRYRREAEVHVKGNALRRVFVMSEDNWIGRISDFVKCILKFESVPKCWSSLIRIDNKITGFIKWNKTLSA